MPSFQTRERIRPDQPGQGLPQTLLSTPRQQRIKRERTTLPAYFPIVNLHAGSMRKRKPQHRQSIFRRRAGHSTQRRITCGNERDVSETKIGERRFGNGQVTKMHRIEGATVQPDQLRVRGRLPLQPCRLNDAATDRRQTLRTSAWSILPDQPGHERAVCSWRCRSPRRDRIRNHPRTASMH